MSIIAVATLYNILYPFQHILINSISLSSSLLTGIYNLISTTKDTDLRKILLISDIINDITVIKSFIEEIEEKNQNKTLLVCINNLNDTLEQLEKIINSINKKFEEHNNLWFSYFRSYDITSEKENIIFLSGQLKHRFELLIKISPKFK